MATKEKRQTLYDLHDICMADSSTFWHNEEVIYIVWSIIEEKVEWAKRQLTSEKVYVYPVLIQLDREIKPWNSQIKRRSDLEHNMVVVSFRYGSNGINKDTIIRPSMFTHNILKFEIENTIRNRRIKQ